MQATLLRPRGAAPPMRETQARCRVPEATREQKSRFASSRRPRLASCGAFGPAPRHCRTRSIIVPAYLWAQLADGRHRVCGLYALMLAVNRAILLEKLGDADNLRAEH